MRQHAPECVDWCFAANMAQRLANDGGPLCDDPGWTAVLVRFLAKVPRPDVFKHLRPIALLSATAKIWSRLLFTRFQPHDEDLDPGAMGFKKGYSVAELVLCFRCLRDRALDGGGGSGQHSWTSLWLTTVWIIRGS